MEPGDRQRRAGPSRFLCINTDVTNRKQLEQELQRAQRTESLGMLAAALPMT